MAEITTTISGPEGPIYALRGRVPRDVALDACEGHLRQQIAAAEKALSTVSEWRVTSQRGSEGVLTFEELEEWRERNGA